MRTRTLAFVFILSLSISLIINIPIGWLLKSGRLGSVSVHDVSGTIWNGRVGLVDVTQRHQIKNLSWDVSLASIVLGALNVHLKFSYLNGQGQGDAAISCNKVVTLSDFEYSAEVNQFAQKFAKGFVGLEGHATMRINTLTYTIGEHFLRNLSGDLLWAQSGIVRPVFGSFGDVSINLSQDADIINADISNAGGEVSLSGSASVNSDRQYQIDALVRPDSSISDALRSVLGVSMKAENDGSFRLNLSGRM